MRSCTGNCRRKEREKKKRNSMEIVDMPTPNKKVLTYNEAHPFTRRVPTFLTEKQKVRDSKTVRQIVHAYDIENDKQKLMDIFFSKCHLLSDPVYWEVLRSVWVTCGATENAAQFRPYFSAKRRAKSWFMTPEDAGYLDSLSFPVNLWRAYDDEEDGGVSWTNDYEWCRNREDIYAYISRRGESEFIIL